MATQHASNSAELLHELQVHQVELEMQNEALRQAQSALEESRDRYVSLYDGAPVGYFTLSQEGLITEANLTGATLLGTERTRLLQTRFAAWVIPADRPRWAEIFLSIVPHGGKGRLELALQRQDDTVLHAQLDYEFAQQKVGAGGTALRLVLSDITQQKLSVAEARRQSEWLAQQARLVLLGELASVLAHEINQPLAAIAGYAAVCARKTSASPDVLELVRAIETQALRAGEIAWRIRGFARRQRTGRSPIDLYEVIAGVVKWLHLDSAYPDADIDMTGVDAGLPPVNADRGELEQVLINLLRNGIEASMPADKPRIVITSGRGQQPGEIEVQITDWGCGFPASVSPNDFQPFTSTKAQGLGLGLTISFSIIEGHGGRLWATPNPGGGTIFYFTLPVAEQAVPTS